MLVSATETGWKIIYQRAHGLLAAQIAAQWKAAERPPYWTQTLVAIAEHDDGLAESSAAENLTEAGAPRHFQLLKFSPAQYRNVMEIASSKSRWNALMTSLHLSFIYGGLEEADADLKSFVKEQDAYQKRLCKELKITGAEARRWYRFVEWCDAFSLLLCMDKVQPEQRRMDISTGPNGTTHQLWQDQAGHLRVEPWPFEANSFDVEVEYRTVNQLSFASPDEFAQAMQKAEVQVMQWRFRRSEK
ncbi:MAG: DUF3891 family protein [Cytophagales bacterium]|jgi:hypothetical protein|nr:DUF3891 family protein [Cytophagales bacterium]